MWISTMGSYSHIMFIGFFFLKVYLDIQNLSYHSCQDYQTFQKTLLLTVSVLIITGYILTLLFTFCYIFSPRKQKNELIFLNSWGKFVPSVYNFLSTRYHIASLSPRNVRYRQLHFGKNNGNPVYTHFAVFFYQIFYSLLYQELK